MGSQMRKTGRGQALFFVCPLALVDYLAAKSWAVAFHPCWSCEKLRSWQQLLAWFQLWVAAASFFLCGQKLDTYHFCWLLIISFAVQKLSSSIQSYASIFIFCCLYFWCHIQNTIAWPVSRIFSPMFCSSSFRVSGLMFKYLIHFELIIVCVVW